MYSIPCSNVGHIYRDFHPYKLEEGQVMRNNLRMVKVVTTDKMKILSENLKYDCYSRKREKQKASGQSIVILYTILIIK